MLLREFGFEVWLIWVFVVYYDCLGFDWNGIMQLKLIYNCIGVNNLVN